MPFVEELWNNITSSYKNWHKKINWFSIIIKSKQMVENRKEKEMEKRTCAAQRPTGRPSQQAAQPNCQELLQAPASRSCCVAAPQPAVATSPRHLLLLPLVAWITRATPRTPRTSLTLSRSPSSPSSFSPDRSNASSPPLAVAVATAPLESI